MILEEHGPKSKEELRKIFYNKEIPSKEYDEVLNAAILSVRPFISGKSSSLNQYPPESNDSFDVDDEKSVFSLVYDDEQILSKQKTGSPSSSSPYSKTTKKKKVSLLRNFNFRSKQVLFAHDKEEKNNDFLLQQERDFQMQGMIIRIMKQKKMLKKEDLVQMLLKDSKSYVPTKEKIENNLQQLLEKEYIMENGKFLQYKA